MDMKSTPTSFHDLSSLNKLREHKGSSEREALKAATKEFEAYFLNLMLKNMRSANEVISSEENPLTSSDVSFYNEMHDQQMAVNLSRSSNFGIGDILYRQLSAHLPKDESETTPHYTVNNAEPIRLPAKSNESKPGTPSSTAQVSLSFNEKVRSELPDNQTLTTQAVNQNEVNRKAFNQTLNHSTEKTPVFESKEDFIESVKPFALKAAQSLGVHPGVLIAQAALETGWGKYFGQDHNGKPSFNLFGIKADTRWSGDSVSTTTIEFSQGLPEKVRQNFRAYDSIKESFNDYVKFVQDNPRYQKALENNDDPKGYLENLHQGGYATDPNYADKIHSIFVRESLHQIAE